MWKALSCQPWILAFYVLLWKTLWNVGRYYRGFGRATPRNTPVLGGFFAGVWNKEEKTVENLVESVDKIFFSTAGPVEIRFVRLRPEACPPQRQTPGSVSFVPSVAGLMIAGEVLRSFIEKAE